MVVGRVIRKRVVHHQALVREEEIEAEAALSLLEALSCRDGVHDCCWAQLSAVLLGGPNVRRIFNVAGNVPRYPAGK